MRHFYTALLRIAMAMMPAHADTTDLLEGAVTADDSYYYNPDSFYAFWQGQYADGHISRRKRAPVLDIR